MKYKVEPSFRESVDLMFNRAADILDLPSGLEEKIRICNATCIVRFTASYVLLVLDHH
jgi:glutamate dehydrogenase (NAD(P)+)